MLKPAGPGICTRGGNGKTVKRAKMESWQARGSENLPTSQYQRGNLRFYQPTKQAINLAMRQFTYLSVYLSSSQSTHQSINLSIYQTMGLLFCQSVDLPIFHPSDLSIYQSINLRTYQSNYQTINLATYRVNTLSIYPFINLSIF